MRARGRRLPHGKLRAPALRFPFVALKILLLAAIAYGGVAAFVWFAQESLIFYPPPVAGRAAPPRGWRLEDVSFTTRDGTVLVGVFALPPVDRAPVVIYFGGNAEEVTSYAPQANETYGPRAALLVNYRGYGASKGRPSEKSLVSDGIELFDWVRARGDVDSSRIAIHGRSLGTGVAVQVAAARPPRCIVLTSPLASARDLAKEIYPWLPVAFLLRHPFDSVSLAPRLSFPALVLIAGADSVVAPRHSQRLARAWGSPAEIVVLEGFDHNDLQLDPRYAGSIHAFLDRHL